VTEERTPPSTQEQAQGGAEDQAQPGAEDKVPTFGDEEPRSRAEPAQTDAAAADTGPDGRLARIAAWARGRCRAVIAWPRDHQDAVRSGAPLMALGILVVGLLAALVLIAGNNQPAVKAYAELIVTGPSGCNVTPERERNVIGCSPRPDLGRNVFQITFKQTLTNSTPVVSLSSCCLGSVSASVLEPNSALVVFGRKTQFPATASILVP
jgi:hypothetical protein